MTRGLLRYGGAMKRSDTKSRSIEIPEKRENFADAGRADRFYRFSVKCVRDENDKISKMAAKNGMSPTELVQRHFETLFVVGFSVVEPEAAKPKIEAPVSRAPKIDPDRRKQEMVERVHAYMVSLADRGGNLTLRMSVACSVLSCRYGSITEALQALIRDGRVKRLTVGTTRQPATYRVIG